MKHPLPTLLVVLAALALVACAEAPEPAPDLGSAVALVDGKAITEGQFDAYARRRGGGEGDRLDIINDLISIELLVQAAERAGKHLERSLAAEIASQRAALLAQAMVRERLDTHPITDEAIEAEYQRFLEQDLGEELSARHILVRDEETARGLITQLNEGADFEALAREHSQDGSAQAGGDLGWFDQDMMVEPFGATAASLEVGQYTREPVQTRFGWHIIRLDGRRRSAAPPIEEIREEIVGFLQSQMIEAWVNELRGQASVEIR